jgi:Mce-associated membrane protein
MEGNAGASRLNPADGSSEESEEVAAEAATEETVDETVSKAPADPAAESASRGQPSRLGPRWLIGICAALLVVSAALGAGGYLTLRANADSSALSRADAAAVKAAQECVAATQAPDTAAMNLAQQKIIECSTGNFLAQAMMYSSMLVDAYKAANVAVKVSNMRAGVERHNDDGSIQVLVAVQVKVTNSDAADQVQGYRLRLQMAQDQGQYKIAKLDQVSN